jgi:hypothetical protein
MVHKAKILVILHRCNSNVTSKEGSQRIDVAEKMALGTDKCSTIVDLVE